MSIDDAVDTFAGLPVVDSDVGTDSDPRTVAWRITNYYATEHFPDLVEELMDRTGPGGPVALIVRDWGAAHHDPFPVDVLAANAYRLVDLRALFIGEMSSEECEISWIRHGDITPLLAAFPGLERLWVRGSEGLRLIPVRHEKLRELVFQSGRLPASVVRAIGACDLPALEELELWLGVARYGGDTTVADLALILAGRSLPALTWLGLRNAEIADDLAAALAASPVVARLRVLDLSMGTLGDRGAESLLAGQPLTHLETLDLSHHFMSPELVQRLTDELPGVTLHLGDEQAEEEWGRYTAVSE
ncbi:STM4015 family protein [Actinoplanes sp. NPDC020271]|uniref:STM4015 family protein n=1 Tax=Actinoplanes sp. NPDC020271 TaxID=3363896 RepID=UPI00378DA597